MSEIFNNIADHTDRPNGGIFIQHFPRKNEISISVADFGIGIPNRVRSLRPEMNDHAAIIAAVQQGFTTKTTPRNRGAGLDYLLQTVCATNIGTVAICSLTGHVVFYHLGNGVGHTTYPIGSGFCPGTTIEIRLRTDRITNVDDGSEDLEW